MRSFKIALALVAVLAMVGTTFADVTMTVTPTPGFSNPDLDSWLVKIYGEPRGFTDINILGDVVHQVNQFGPSGAVASCFLDVIPGDEAQYDTHLMFNTPGLIVGTYLETNDQSNPAGLTSEWYKFGMGNFATETGTGFSLQSPLAEGADFMQVVLKKGTISMLSFWTPVTPVGGGNPVDTLFEQPVGIPEPGTVVMLIAGALCLVVIRFRKK